MTESCLKGMRLIESIADDEAPFCSNTGSVELLTGGSCSMLITAAVSSLTIVSESELRNHKPNPSLLFRFSMRRYRPFTTNVSDSVYRTPWAIATNCHRSVMKIDLS